MNQTTALLHASGDLKTRWAMHKASIGAVDHTHLDPLSVLIEYSAKLAEAQIAQVGLGYLAACAAHQPALRG
jgi:hypothetical protein